MSIKLKNSTNTLDEQSRQTGISGAKNYLKLSRKFGVITEIHEKMNAVKIKIDGEGIANQNRFIPLTNSWQEITMFFGELEIGNRVRLEYDGDQENFSTATVIGLQGETIAQDRETSDKLLALYEIFLPGV